VKTLGLVVEIDGTSHDDKAVYDRIRQQYLESLGLVIFRITDFDVRNNLGVVMMDLEYFIIQHFGTNPSSEIQRISESTPPEEGNVSAGGFIIGK